MGATDLHDIPEGHRFFVERGPQRLQRREQFFPQGDQRRDVHGGGKHIVRALAFIDIVIGVDFSRHPPLTAEQFTGAVSQHLVHIHIALGAGTGLPDSQRELLGVFSGQYFVSGGDDRPGFLRRQQAKILIDLRRRPLGQREGIYQFPGHFFGRDAEMLQRTLGLGAPEFIGRDVDGAHRVFFTAMRCHYFLLG